LLKDVKTNKKIDRWFQEDWINVKKALQGIHAPCGRSNKKEGEYPVCRPMKRISKETSVTLPELLKVKGVKEKLKKAIKQKEKNPKVRIEFKKMIE